MLIGSGAVFQTMNSTVTMNLATIFKLRGVNFTISAACASGSHSIGMGYHLIKSGMQDCIICGGAQELSHYSMGSFDALSAFSVKEADPAKASKPFDRDRDGLVPSGGAATVILESLESALKEVLPFWARLLVTVFHQTGAISQIQRLKALCVRLIWH
ncbi:beta-ketoacyl synthase N-terminal-like domain-containing protein [Mucilaginibacter sp. UC70_90]